MLFSFRKLTPSSSTEVLGSIDIGVRYIFNYDYDRFELDPPGEYTNMAMNFETICSTGSQLPLIDLSRSRKLNARQAVGGNGTRPLRSPPFPYDLYYTLLSRSTASIVQVCRRLGRLFLLFPQTFPPKSYKLSLRLHHRVLFSVCRCLLWPPTMSNLTSSAIVGIFVVVMLFSTYFLW